MAAAIDGPGGGSDKGAEQLVVALTAAVATGVGECGWRSALPSAGSAGWVVVYDDVDALFVITALL